MSDPENGQRTHEPSLRELTAELDGLRLLVFAKLDAMKEVINERDKQYKERFDSSKTAVDAALAAVKDQTKGSFDSSEKAIVKAEDAQKSYNVAHNDLAKKMDEQNKATMPRLESQQRFDNLSREIAELKGTILTTGGKAVGGQLVKDESRANIGLFITLGLAVLMSGTALVSVVLFVIKH